MGPLTAGGSAGRRSGRRHLDRHALPQRPSEISPRQRRPADRPEGNGLGIRIIQLAGYDVYYEPSTPHTVERFGQQLRAGVSLAASAGVILAFETMETPFMNTVQKAMAWVTECSSPYLQVYPDIGNLTNGAPDVPADLNTGAGHLVAAHLKETREGVFRDLFYGDGRVDFGVIIPALWALGVRKYVTEFWAEAGADGQQRICAAHDYARSLLSPLATVANR